MNPSATIIAQLRELQALTSARADMLEESRDQERARAEAAEAELRELRKAMVGAVAILDECHSALWHFGQLNPNKCRDIAERIDAWRKS
jgi:hypothetical protein